MSKPPRQVLGLCVGSLHRHEGKGIYKVFVTLMMNMQRHKQQKSCETTDRDEQDLLCNEVYGQICVTMNMIEPS
jgi:hypothetical protein